MGTIKKQLLKLNKSPTLSVSVLNNIREVVNGLDNDIWKNSIAHVIRQENEYPILPTIAPVVIQTGFYSDFSSDDCDYTYYDAVS